MNQKPCPRGARGIYFNLSNLPWKLLITKTEIGEVFLLVWLDGHGIVPSEEDIECLAQAVFLPLGDQRLTIAFPFHPQSSASEERRRTLTPLALRERYSLLSDSTLGKRLMGQKADIGIVLPPLTR